MSPKTLLDHRDKAEKAAEPSPWATAEDADEVGRTLCSARGRTGSRRGRRWILSCKARRPRNFPKMQELVRLLDRFTRQPRDFSWLPHPIFDHMSDWEWARWGYLHMDRHLRQFGA